ncbi:MAG TPA: hypothetical protein VF190_05760 [Rhodothermales bacterium]
MAYAITRDNVAAAQREQVPPKYTPGKGYTEGPSVRRERAAVAKHNRRPSSRKRP